jgi:colanic acid/amylovoran biosynthesis glycosyltransferase
MKVTFCAYDKPGYVGGPNAGLIRLLPILRLKGIQPKVLFITHAEPEKCPTVQALRQKGFDCPAIYGLLYTEERIRWLLEQLEEDPPDIFVPNLVVPALYAGKWVRRAKIPTVGVLRSDEDFYYGLLDEFVFSKEEYRLSALVCVSKFLEQYVVAKKPDAVIIKQIPSGTPVPEQSAKPPQETLRIVYTGRLVEEQKHISDVTLAFCRVVREVPGVEATIYGDGPSAPSVKRIIEKEGKGLPVSYAGRVDSDVIQKHLLEHHIIVLLSDYEGLPVSLMEAMACGLVPVCLNTRSGIPELVEDGVTGLIVNDRGDEFVAAIRKLKNDRNLWERLSKATRQKIEQEYSIDICADKWVELFKEIKQKSSSQSQIEIPHKVILPPPNPVLVAQQDRRQPTLLLCSYKKTRRLAGKMKRRLLKISSIRNKNRLNPRIFNPRFYHLKLLRETLELIAQKHITPQKKSVLLDFGCGTKPYRKIFENYVTRYIGVDISKNPSVDSYSDYQSKTLLPDAYADIILSTQVLEHVENPTGYLQECYRLLKHDGLFILSTHGTWKYHPNPKDLWRWTGEGLKKVVTENKFYIIDFYGLMGPASTSIYLLQDALISKIPCPLKPFFTIVMQGLSILADRLISKERMLEDACVFVAVSRKK